MNQATASLNKQIQTNPTAKPESWKEEFLFSCTYMCYLELSVFLLLICCGQERVKIAVIMKLLRYIAGISSLPWWGVHLSSFSSVSPCSELQLLCAHVLYG